MHKLGILGLVMVMYLSLFSKTVFGLGGDCQSVCGLWLANGTCTEWVFPQSCEGDDGTRDGTWCQAGEHPCNIGCCQNCPPNCAPPPPDDGGCDAINGGWTGWSECSASCTQTRTCTNPAPECDGSYCGGASSQACVGGACTVSLTGTLFDASNLESCPASIDADLLLGGATFDVTSDTTAPQEGTTDANGDFLVTVVPDVLPKTYSFDFTKLYNTGRIADVTPLLYCQGATATTVAGETTVNDFGFLRLFGGWWQVTGGNVHAQNGITSVIPRTVIPEANQKLILPDANGRSGILSFGTPWNGDELGNNPVAAVSAPLWRIESLYEGLRYDYDFYNTRMSIFTSSDWDGESIIYDDGGKDYQILKHTGDVTLNYSGPTGTEKVILLVNGNVNIDNDVMVPEGAFLGIIAKGNITFGTTVASAQGWFIAENISVPCHDGNVDGGCDKDDVQFVGEGTFVGWTGINLARDREILNNTTPSEKFIYRPDMSLNAPMPFKTYTKRYSPFVP
jgi:hypothetical protein